MNEYCMVSWPGCNGITADSLISVLVLRKLA